jgi:hypothetical protein
MGAKLLGRLEQACHTRDLGWVHAGSLAQLVSSLAGEETVEEAENEHEEPVQEARPKKAPPAQAPVQSRLPFKPV